MLETNSNFGPLERTGIPRNLASPQPFVRQSSSQISNGFVAQYPYSHPTGQKVATIIDGQFDTQTTEAVLDKKELQKTFSKKEMQDFPLLAQISPHNSPKQGDRLDDNHETFSVQTRERGFDITEKGEADAVLAGIAVKKQIDPSDIQKLKKYFSDSKNLEAGTKAFLNLMDGGQFDKSIDILKDLIPHLSEGTSSELIKGLDVNKQGFISKILIEELNKFIITDQLSEAVSLFKALDRVLVPSGQQDSLSPFISDFAPKIAKLAKGDIDSAVNLIRQFDAGRAKQLANTIFKNYTHLSLAQGSTLVIKLMDKEIAESNLTTFMRTDTPTTAFFSSLQAQMLEEKGIKQTISNLGSDRKLFSASKDFKSSLRRENNPSIFTKRDFAKACNQSFAQIARTLDGKIPKEMQILYSHLAEGIEDKFKNDSNYKAGQNLNLVRSLLFLRGIQPILVIESMLKANQSDLSPEQKKTQSTNRILHSDMILTLVQGNSFENDYKFMEKGLANQKATKLNLEKVTKEMLGTD